jgi:hypothetical protein
VVSFVIDNYSIYDRILFLSTKYVCLFKRKEIDYNHSITKTTIEAAAVVFNCDRKNIEHAKLKRGEKFINARSACYYFLHQNYQFSSRQLARLFHTPNYKRIQHNQNDFAYFIDKNIYPDLTKKYRIMEQSILKIIENEYRKG